MTFRLTWVVAVSNWYELSPVIRCRYATLSTSTWLDTFSNYCRPNWTLIMGNLNRGESQVSDLCESVQICRIFSAGFCKDLCTESWRSIQICKIFTEVCRFSLKIFAEMFFCSFQGTNILHFWTSTTLSSILADLRSVSRNSPSPESNEKEISSPSR